MELRLAVAVVCLTLAAPLAPAAPPIASDRPAAAGAGSWPEPSDEREAALRLIPDARRGRDVYELCSACHGAKGWGRADGGAPEIAGQPRDVVIKQLADIRAGARDNPMMAPFADPSEIGGEQSIADVAEYISRLPMNPANGVGSGRDLAHGAQLYKDNCAACHGAKGEGDGAQFYPRLAGQHFRYLARQFDAIKTGRRRNSHPAMQAAIQAFSEKDAAAVLDYASRLKPPKSAPGRKGALDPDLD